MRPPIEPTTAPRPSRLAVALRQGVLLAAALLVTPAFAAPPAAEGKKDKPAATAPAKKATASGKAADKGAKAARGTKTAKKAEPQKPGPLADFGKASPSPDVVHVANWASHSRNHQKKAFIVIDKKNAQMYVFDPQAKLKSTTPVLLGKAVGDHSAPGIGNKPISQIKEHEKTTPAGRFLVMPGKNTNGEDILWIDYNAAVSMHRMRKVSAKQQRAERMSTPGSDDNRISSGCVNVPHAFYNGVLKPTVMKHGAYVYVLPETKTPQQQFASYDVGPNSKAAVQVAEASAARKRAGM